MPTPPSNHAPKLLAWDQIDANRRRVRVLLAVFGLALLPFAFWIAHQIAAWLAILVLPPLLGWERAFDDPAATIALAAFLAIQLTVGVAWLAHRGAARRLLRVTGARLLGADEAPVLRRTVENLCIGSGLPEPAIAIVDAPGINAFSTGLDPATSTLAVTRGALDSLDRRELEGLVAHELVQIAGHDVRLGTVIAGLVRFMWLPLAIVGGLFRGVRALLAGLGAGPTATTGCLVALVVWIGMPLLGLVLGMYSLALDVVADDPRTGWILLALMAFPFYVVFVTPVIGLLMFRAMSRGHVFRADADALVLTRNPAGLARALAKMDVAGNAAVVVPAATRLLWVVDPADVPSHGWHAWLAPHPPLADRIATIARMGDVPDGDIEAARRACAPPAEAGR